MKNEFKLCYGDKCFSASETNGGLLFGAGILLLCIAISVINQNENRKEK